MNKPIKIALVDDQNLFREGMNLVLSTFDQFEVTIDASSGQQLLDQLEDGLPDVVLLDYTMPDMDGYETLQKIKEGYPDIKVIMLTMHYDESLMSYMMQNGADGYLLKDETSSVVKEAIIEVVEKGKYFPTYVSNALLKQLQQEIKSKYKREKSKDSNTSFSLREREILGLIGKQNRQQMADELFISIKTIDFHLKNLKLKTKAESTAELVRFALTNGFQD